MCGQQNECRGFRFARLRDGTIVWKARSVAQPGRALGLGPRRRRFKSCRSDHSHFGANRSPPYGIKGFWHFHGAGCSCRFDPIWALCPFFGEHQIAPTQTHEDRIRQDQTPLACFLPSRKKAGAALVPNEGGRRAVLPRPRGRPETLGPGLVRHHRQAARRNRPVPAQTLPPWLLPHVRNGHPGAAGHGAPHCAT